MVVTAFCSVGGGCAGYNAAGGRDRLRELRNMRGSNDDEDDAEQERLAFERGLETDVIQKCSVEHRYKGAQRTDRSAGANGSDEDSTKCMVCMETFEDGDRLRTLPCFH